MLIAASYVTLIRANILGQYLVKIICDDTTIFVDGEQMNAEGQNDKMTSLYIPSRTSTIGIQCKNEGGPHGIMVQVADDTGKVFAVSDDSWSCSNQAQQGWSSDDFTEDSSWNLATWYKDWSGTAWRDMSPNRKVIWTDSAADTTVYCRKELPKPTGNYNRLQ